MRIRSRPAARFAVLIAVLAAIGLLAALLGTPDQARLEEFVARAGSIGPAVAVAGYALGVLVMVPRTFLSFLVGLLYGWLPGFAYAMVGALLGASIGFACGRLLGREYVDAKLRGWEDAAREKPAGARAGAVHWAQRKLAVADTWLARRGILGMWMLRMIPIAHYGVTSYACGTATVRYRHFLIGSLLGSIPGALGYTAVGASLLSGGGVPLALGLTTGLALLSLGTIMLFRRRAAAGSPSPRTPSRTG